jgi:hypothetical protein
VEVFLTTRGIRRRLADTYQSTKRFNDAKAVEIHGGYTAIFVNEIPVVIDDDIPKGWAFALRDDAFRWGEIAPPGWLRTRAPGRVAARDGLHARPAPRRLAGVVHLVQRPRVPRPEPDGRDPNAQDDASG